MHFDSQWLPALHVASDSDSSWLQDSYYDDDLGFSNFSQWFTSNGNYDASRSSWTPESFLEVDAPNNNDPIPRTTGFTTKANYTDSPASSGHENLVEPPPTLHWNDDMTSTAHSDFFGLDLGIGFAPSFEVSDDVFNRAQATLQKWSDVTSKPSSPDSTKILTPSVANASQSESVASSSGNQRGSVLSKSASPPSRVQKTFHFVENSDKKTATRLRNTLTSRNLRQSKVSRIAELERELERQQQETEMWRRRALEAGWKNDE